MMTLGNVDVPFHVVAKGIDMAYDTQTQQQFLTFNFALRLSVPQLLAQLVEIQRNNRTLDNATFEVDSLTGVAPPTYKGKVSSPPGHLTGAAGPASYSGGPRGEACDGGSPNNNNNNMALAKPQASFREERAADGRRGEERTSETALVEAPSSQRLSAQQAITPANAQLIEALRQSSPSDVAQAIKLKADVNCIESGSKRRAPLHFALECGGNVEVVSHLITARSVVNSQMANGRTPLHIAVYQYQSLPFAVMRMLVCARADFALADSRGVTPLDGAKIVAMETAQAGGNKDKRSGNLTRQLLSEVTERPTVALHVCDCWEVRGIQFADMENDRIMFYTESTIGLYSLHQNRTIFTKRLRQVQVQSSVVDAFVNPELGTIAVCVDMKGPRGVSENIQSVILIWPNGRLQYEEPLKLSIKVGGFETVQPVADPLPACVILSRTQGPQTLVCRLADGQVFRRRLNAARSQLVGETKLTGSGGLLACDEEAAWVAIAKTDADLIEVWHDSERLNGIQKVAYVNKRPQAMAVSRLAREGAYLAISVGTLPTGEPAPVEVLRISAADGAVASIYRLAVGAPCLSLTFCHRLADRLVICAADGLVIFSYLPKGVMNLCHDSPGMRCVSPSPDRQLCLSAEANYFRVFKLNWAASE